MAFYYAFINKEDKLLELILSRDRTNIFTYLHYLFCNAKNYTPEIRIQIQLFWERKI